MKQGIFGRKSSLTQLASLIILGCFAVTPARVANGAGISSAAGKLDVVVKGSINPAATSSTCATAQVGNVTGGAANFSTMGQPVNPNNACTNTFFDDRGNPVGVFDGRGKIGASALPKFPGGTGSGVISMMTLSGGVAPDSTLAVGIAGFASVVTPANPIGGIPFPIFDSQLAAIASVNKPTALAPIGVASGVSVDPWFFAPTTSDTLTITVTLLDVDLSVSTGGGDHGFGEVAAFGAFEQVDPTDPLVVISILADWNFIQQVTDGGTVSIPAMTLLSRSFDVMPGNLYELTADIGALVSVVPEASSLTLFGIGVLAIALVRRHKPKSGETLLTKIVHFPFDPRG
jgi:PEP-CTERM motif